MVQLVRAKPLWPKSFHQFWILATPFTWMICMKAGIQHSI